MFDVTVLLLAGGLPSTSIAPLEIFSCAGTLYSMIVGSPSEPHFRVRTATLDGTKTTHFVPIELEPAVSLSEVDHTDLVIVPTAGMDIPEACKANAGLVDWLASHGNEMLAVAGICTGVSLLAEAGLLDGRRATTHWAVVEQCRARYPKVKWEGERFLTEQDNVFCSGGLYASIDLSLYLVERFAGHEVAVQTAKALLLETPRVWQSSYAAAAPRSLHDDAEIQAAQSWLFEHFREEVQMDGLAAQVGMSPRNFARRFKAAVGESPLAYLHRLRIDAARHYLESENRPVTDIALAVGYEDVAFFRRLFQRHTGVSPRAYRARFGPRARA